MKKKRNRAIAKDQIRELVENRQEIKKTREVANVQIREKNRQKAKMKRKRRRRNVLDRENGHARDLANRVPEVPVVRAPIPRVIPIPAQNLKKIVSAKNREKAAAKMIENPREKNRRNTVKNREDIVTIPVRIRNIENRQNQKILKNVVKKTAITIANPVPNATKK